MPIVQSTVILDGQTVIATEHGPETVTFTGGQAAVTDAQAAVLVGAPGFSIVPELYSEVQESEAVPAEAEEPAADDSKPSQPRQRKSRS